MARGDDDNAGMIRGVPRLRGRVTHMTRGDDDNAGAAGIEE